MSGRLRRNGRRAGIAAAAILFVSGVGGWVLLSTAPGLRFAWGFLEGRLPETVRVEQVSGRLRGPLELTGLWYAGAGADADVSNVRIEWRLWPLLRRALDIDRLEIDGVRVRTLDSESVEEPSPPPSVSFPLRIEIASALVTDIQLFSPDADSGPNVVDSLTLTNVSLGPDVAIGALVASAPQGRIGASGRLTPDARYPFEIEASWEIPTPEWGTIVGRGSVAGDLDLLEIAASLREPLEATFAGRVSDAMGAGVVDGHVTISETEFRRFAAEAPEGSASVDVDIAGIVDSVRATGRARVDAPNTGPVDLEASLEWRTGAVFVDRLRARLGAAIIDVTGDIALLPDGPRTDLAVAWSDLRWPLQDEAQLRSASGTAQIRGTQEAYSVEGDSRLSADGWPAARVYIRGNGNPESLALEEIRVDAPEGRLSGRGTVGWAPAIRWNMELSGRDLDTHAVLPDSIPWQGLLSFDGRSQGSLQGNLLVANVTVDTLQGTLRDAPVGASTSARLRARLAEGVPDWASAELSLHWLEAEWGTNRAFASGSVGDTILVAWTVAVPDLGVAGTEVRGSIEGLGRVTGDRAFPELEALVEAHDIVTESARVAAAFAEGVIETAPGGIVEVEATAEDVGFGDQIVDAIDLGIRGSPEAHDIRGTFTSATDSLRVAASGGVAERRWSGIVERFDVVARQVGTWQLVSPVESTLSVDSARVEQACWTSAPSEVCAAVRWAADGSGSLAFAVEDLPGERLSRSLPAGWALAAGIDVTGSVSIADDGALSADVQADFGSGRVQHPAAEGTSELVYSAASLQLGVSEAGARASFEGAVDGEERSDAITLKGDISLPDYARLTDTFRSQAIEGVIEAHVRDFGAVDALMPQMESMAGDLRVDVDLSGSVERPEFVGEGRLREGRVDLPSLGLELREIELTARGRGLDGISVEGSATSGTGRVMIEGEIPVAPSAEGPARVRFSGTRVHAVALPEAQIWVSPDVTITAHPERVGLTGQVRVPRALVELSEIAESAVRPSRDVVFVGETTGTGPLPSLGLNVRVELGDSVSFRGLGFSADPRGSLVASDGPGGTMTATGEVTLTNGRYRAYGQDLTIERGRVLFAGGPIENPGLDIRAARTAQDGVVAGLQVAGTLRRPEVTLFSEPAMMESEALAYIVLGRPLGTASTTEGSRVANAAASLGIREGNVLASRIAERFGLAEVRVSADGPLEEASLIAGKYLSPALYVSYGVGLFEPISTFRLRYLLSGGWTLQAESGRSTGADLLYRIERGR